MVLKENWLADVLTDVQEEVARWPEWKRSDEVRREILKLDEQNREAVAAPVRSTEAKP